MKKYLFIASITLIGCQQPKEITTEETPSSPPGYVVQGGKKTAVDDANPENLVFWDRYIQAHNKRDLETISAMNNDSITIYTQDGNKTVGTKAHLENLNLWFDASDPKWNTYFSYTMKIEGQKGAWVISGHEMTETVEGKTLKHYDITDAYIEDEKVKAFWVYQRKQENPSLKN